MPVHLLILASYRTLEGFQEFQAASHLLAGLESRGIAWERRQPREPMADLEYFDAVFCWTYRHTWYDHLLWAGRVEERAARLGIPVINPSARFTYLHSPDLEVWQRHGIRAPVCQRFGELAEIHLPYPLVLRRDSEHRGHRMYRAESPDEARRAVARDREEFGDEKPIDLAVELIDTRWPDGFYRKRRSYVAGGEVIPAHAVRSNDWIVNFGSRADEMGSYREDRQFLEEGEPRADLVRQAAAALKADLAALDYSPAPDGSYVFWEANRNPRMWGDHEIGVGKPRAADRLFGEALADLVLRRVEESGRRPVSPWRGD